MFLAPVFILLDVNDKLYIFRNYTELLILVFGTIILFFLFLLYFLIAEFPLCTGPLQLWWFPSKKNLEKTSPTTFFTKLNSSYGNQGPSFTKVWRSNFLPFVFPNIESTTNNYFYVSLLVHLRERFSQAWSLPLEPFF